MEPIISLNIILYCKKYGETLRFYRDMLGLPVSADMGWLTEFRASENSFITVADEARSSVKSAGGLGITITLKVNDADEAGKNMRAAGMSPGETGDFPPNARRFFLHDPEGNRIEVWSEKTR